MSESWWEYVQRISARALNKDIAAAARCDPTTVSHWKSGKNPGADNVVAFARAYQRNPQEALVAAGILTREDLEGAVQLRDSITEFSDVELADETHRRLTTYSDVVEEIVRRYESGDPRTIVPGSAGDVFPPFGGNSGNNAQGRLRRG